MAKSRTNFKGKFIAATLSVFALLPLANAQVTESKGLKNIYSEEFLVGTMVQPEIFMRENARFNALLSTEFNSLVSGNEFKWLFIHPTRTHYDFTYPDAFVAYGESRGMHLQGHVLVWHSQFPPSLFLTEDGEQISAEDLDTKLEEHISTIVGRYKGRIDAWDVVNEAFNEAGWENNKWYQILGESYVEKAYSYAHAADPNAELVYNDYGLANEAKRDVVLENLGKLKNQGVPIHAVGLQGHFGLTEPALDEIEDAIVDIAQQGFRVHVSELEVDVLPSISFDTAPDYAPELDPYREGLPDDVQAALAQRYQDIFEVFIKHSDKIDRVTFWGTHDGESWKNDFPIEGRINYPLLFDRYLNKKPAYKVISALKAGEGK